MPDTDREGAEPCRDTRAPALLSTDGKELALRGDEGVRRPRVLRVPRDAAAEEAVTWDECAQCRETLTLAPPRPDSCVWSQLLPAQGNIQTSEGRASAPPGPGPHEPTATPPRVSRPDLPECMLGVTVHLCPLRVILQFYTEDAIFTAWADASIEVLSCTFSAGFSFKPFLCRWHYEGSPLG